MSFLMNRSLFFPELYCTKLITMKKKISFAFMITCLLLMATSAAFSQDNSAQQNKAATTSKKAIIEKVVANLNHSCISVTLANLDPKGDYHLLLYNSDKELMNTYWVDGNDVTLFVGAIAASNYELVLKEGDRVVDTKDMLLQ